MKHLSSNCFHIPVHMFFHYYHASLFSKPRLLVYAYPVPANCVTCTRYGEGFISELRSMQ